MGVQIFENVRERIRKPITAVLQRHAGSFEMWFPKALLPEVEGSHFMTVEFVDVKVEVCSNGHKRIVITSVVDRECDTCHTDKL